jgi:hypothetical protein
MLPANIAGSRRSTRYRCQEFIAATSVSFL